MKLRKLILSSFVILVSSFALLAQTATPSPATPIPTAPPAATPAARTPIPFTGRTIQTLQSVTANLTAAQFQAALTAVPATPLSLQQLLATFVALPSGVTTAQIRTIDVYLSPTGSARVVVQYLR